MRELEQYCTFHLDRHFLGIEVAKVQEVIRYQEMTRVPLAPSVVRGLVNLRGQIVTAIDLRRRFGLLDRADDQRPMNVVVRNGDNLVSFLVDDIGDVLEVPRADFERPPGSLQGVARELIRGAYKLPVGLLLAMDTERACEVSSA